MERAPARRYKAILDRNSDDITEFGFYLAVLAYMGFLLSQTLSLSRGGRLVPLAVIIFTSLLCFLGAAIYYLKSRGIAFTNLESDLTGLRGKKREFDETHGDAEGAETSTQNEGYSFRQFLITILMPVGFILLVPYVGFFTMTLVFSVLFIYLSGRPVRWSIAVGVFITGFLYAIYILLLSRTLILRLGPFP